MKKRILKIMAFVAALVLIVGVGTLVNGLVGNPVSKMLAEQTAKKHLEENYKDKDYYIERVSFSFKDVCYHAYVESPSSKDSSFTLSMGMDGKLRHDSYESQVLERWNTAERIDDEYRNAVKAVLQSLGFPEESCMGYGRIEFIPRRYAKEPDVPEYAIITDDLELDALYDVNEFASKAGHIWVEFYDANVTEEHLAELMLKLKEAMDQADVKFYMMDCVLQAPKTEDGTWQEERLDVINFLYRDIYEEGMLERVRIAIQETDAYYQEQDALKKEEEISK